MKNNKKISLGLVVVLQGLLATYSAHAGSIACSNPSEANIDVTGSNVKGLTVLVNFMPPGASVSDQDFSNLKGIEIARLMNERSYPASSASSADACGNVGSVRDYFWDNSGGTFDLTSTVLIVEVPRARSFYDGDRSDEFDQVSSTAIGLSGGPLFDLKEDVLCGIVGGASCPLGSISYKQYDPSSNQFIEKISTPFDFSSLSRSESVFHYDWLFHQHLTLGGNWVEPGVVEHYSFVQLLVGGGDGDFKGKGLWPRSIPSFDADRDGLNGVALGRLALIPTGLNDPDRPSHNLSIGTIVHEAGHTLFNLKDLYDTQAESFFFLKSYDPSTGQRVQEDINDIHHNDWFESYGVGQYSLMGQVRDGARNPPMMNAQSRDLAGIETVRDLNDAGIGDVFTLDWHADGSDPNTARAFKICKPFSLIEECFYIEYRKSGMNRAYSGSGVALAEANRPMFSPDDGLMIWHAEFYDNPANIAINTRKDGIYADPSSSRPGTSGLHFAVSLIQADGLYQLEKERLEVIPPLHEVDGDLFHAGGVNSYHGKWWDGTDAFLIDNISAVGDTMTFRIGGVHNTDLLVDYDSSKFSLYDSAGSLVKPGLHTGAVGMKDLSVISINNEAYRAISGATSEIWESNEFQVDAGFPVPATRETNIFKISSGPAVTQTIDFQFQLEEGVLLYYLDENENRQVIGEPLIVNLKRSLASPVSVGKTQGNSVVKFGVVARPGFNVTDWRVAFSGSTFKRSWSTGDVIEVDINKAIQTNNSGLPVKVQVDAYRPQNLSSSLCGPGNVEEWRWDGNYVEYGSLVRNNDAIYRSHVPNATIYENRAEFAALTTVAGKESFHPNPTYSPSDGFDYTWQRIAVCDSTPVNCSSTPAWVYGHGYDLGDMVTYKGNQWRVRSTSKIRSTEPGYVFYGIDQSIPGAFSEVLRGIRQHTVQNSDGKVYELGTAAYGAPATTYGARLAPFWELVGSCN